MNKHYFSHDHYARTDEKLQEVLLHMGYEGIGYYWTIVEMMHEQEGKLELSKCESIAFAMRMDYDKLQQLINLVFEKDETYFWSDSVLKRIKMQKNKSNKARVSAKKRWENEAKKRNANAMRTHSDSNAINKSKLNKIKLNNNTISNEVAEKEPINNLIGLFKPVNPNFQTLYSNKTQRSALERMVKVHGFEKIERSILCLPEVISRPYAPTITTPLDLEKKMGQLIAFLQKEKNTTTGKVAIQQ